HLQLHHVAAFRGADEAGADVRVFLRKAPDVARIVVVVYDLVAISHTPPSTAKPESAGPEPGATSKIRRAWVSARRKRLGWLCYLAAAGQIADADESGGAQHL